MKFACLLFALVTTANSWGTTPRNDDDSAGTPDRQVIELAKGVYAIRHADLGGVSPQGNSLVVIGDNGVLVVDTSQTFSDARADIDQIKKWTSKPVRYVLNTHWHEDHTRGNRAYIEAFPNVEIVAHAETAKQMHDYYPAIAKDYAARTEQLQKQLSDGKDKSGNALGPEFKKQMGVYLAARLSLQKDWLSVPFTFPTMTFTQELDIDLGNRPVKLEFLGRGNTKGDVVAFLPNEHLVATGDLVDYPVPYLGGGYPGDQPHTLQALLDLDANVYVPGHGPVLRGDKARSYIKLMAQFIKLVADEVDRQVANVQWGGKSADQVAKSVRAAINFPDWGKRFGAKDDGSLAFFDQFSVTDLILTAYHDSWRK